MKFMDDYTRRGLTSLNRNTESLNDLNELGLYLSKETTPEAINTLKLMILANGAGRLDKDFNINKVKKYKETKWYGDVDRRENIIGNLSFNPQNVANELVEILIQNYNVNMNIVPYGSGYSYFKFWVRSFAWIESSNDRFYKRYDMIDKKLDILSYMVDNGALLPSQVQDIKYYIEPIFEDKRNYAYTKEQLLRMQVLLKYQLPNYKRKKFEEKQNKEKLFEDKLTNFYFPSSYTDFIQEEFPRIIDITKSEGKKKVLKRNI